MRKSRTEKLYNKASSNRSDLSLCMPTLSKGHNTSAVIRSAEVFAVKNIYVIGKKFRAEAATVGAHNWVDLCQVPTYDEFFKIMKGRPIIAAHVRGNILLDDFIWPADPVLLIGH